MNNLKVVLSSVSVLAIALLVYFTSAGFTNEVPIAAEKNESISTTCTYYVHISSTADACLDGNYKYCINGGSSTPTTSDIIVVEVPCDRLYTLCVESGTGCSGTIQLPANCPCPLSGIHVTLLIESTARPCNCNG
jgi:hypothetical protein